MIGLLARSSRRFYGRHPWQLVLAIAGVALGVAVYVGVDLATSSARRAFEMSTDLVRGNATHSLLGVSRAIDEAVFRDLVVERGLDAAPVIELELEIVAPARRRVTLLGIDPIEETGFRSFSAFAPGQGTDVTALLTQARSVLVPAALRTELGLEPGSSLTVDLGDRTAELAVAGSLDEAAAAGRAWPPLVADIATAQTLGGLEGRLHRIDLALDAATADALRQSLPAGTTLVASDSRGRTIEELTEAFQTNLTALGLLALVVGMFLIYSTISFTVVQRRRTIGILRALGITRRELVIALGLEAAGIGLIGTAIGVLAGHYLAGSLIDLVLATVADFYFRSGMQNVGPSALVYAQGFALGVAATLIAAAGPLIDAARVSPEAAIRRSGLERETRRRFRVLALASIPMSAAAFILLQIETRSLFLAFTALTFVLLAGAFLVPSSTILLMRLIERAGRRLFALPGLMAVRGVSASLSRTGVATAALSIAVATVIGIGVMVASFRISLVDWLDSTLTADVYINAVSGDALSDEVVDRIAAVEGVDGVSRSRLLGLPTEHGMLGLRAVSPGPEGWGLDIVDGSPEAAIAALEAGSAVAVSEPFAFRHGLARGAELTLPTPEGPRAFTIAGIFRDYNTAGPRVEISLATYARVWRDGGPSAVGVHFARGASEAAAEDRLRDALRGVEGLRVRSTRFIEELSLAIFDRTFRITDVLRVLAAIIAFLGILSALLALELERIREFGVLRALGFGPGDTSRLVMTQTALIGIAAGIVAIPLGTVLAGLLVFVINRRSFGWTMDFVVTPGPVLYGLAIAVGAALLAGVYPSYALAKGELGAALRDE